MLNLSTSAAQPVSDPRTAFEIFRDHVGHWCARRADGLVFGTFFERASAIRFARRECRDATALRLIVATPPGQ
jgi:hypothetical protein